MDNLHRNASYHGKQREEPLPERHRNVPLELWTSHRKALAHEMIRHELAQCEPGQTQPGSGRMKRRLTVESTSNDHPTVAATPFD
jgi:hypothetical protein